ncbi:MAG TPA: lipid A oxidase [Rhizobium sp.]|nr:lipid A oxidase [Rhizobium sp.]
MKKRTASLSCSAAAITAVLLGASVARAEMAISVYGGVQSAPDSDVIVSDQADFNAGWEGNSFAMPPYYGIRGTWWMEELGQPNLGVSLDYTHAKVYADDATLAASGWSHFEYTDGLNLLTLNALYRMPIEGTKFTPYIGAGAGINVPHVEVTRASGTTFNYQFGGATIQAQAGIAYGITDNWSTFVEYKGNYSWVDVDIDSGASLRSNIMTNAINAGLTFRW